MGPFGTTVPGVVDVSLPGGEKDTRPSLNLRMSPELKARLERASEDRDTPQVQIAREALKKHLRETPGSSVEPPVEDDLAQAWKILRSMSSDEGWIASHVALAELKVHLSMPEAAVRRHIIGKLEKRGYISERGEFESDYTAFKVIQ